MGLSLRQYAAHRKALGLSGGTDKAVRKARDAGRITVLADGTVDPVTADREWGGSTDTAKLRGSQPIAQQTYRLDEDENQRPVIIASPTAGMDAKSAATLNQVKVAREKLKFKKELREDLLEEKAIIQRKPARDFVFALAKRYSTGLRAHHSIAGAKIAARFGLREHEVIQVLREEYGPYLEEMSEEPADISPDKPNAQ